MRWRLQQIRLFFIPALLLLINVAPIRGQATEGSILGTVTDPSGATVANGNITVASVETGNARKAVTNDAGEYVVTNLPLGHYTVSAQASGFKRVVQPPVEITVKARVRVDFSLQVGDTSQSVEVTGATPLIRTDSAEVGGVVSRQVLQEIPVFGRNFMSLASLVPGTTSGALSSRQRDFSGSAITIGGAAAEANNFIIDGISNNMEFSGAMGVTPAIDAIQEFAVQTSQYSAEFGRSGGGVVNVAIRSGSNEYHGFAYDYLRNSVLDARPYDFTGTNPPIQPLRRNQFGAGMGMPIIKNRLFLFGNYEGTRFPNSTNEFDIVPTPLEKTGDFSKSGFTVADPFSLAANGTRNPFPGNIIPSSRFDPTGVALLKAYPDPNYTDPNPTVRNNYYATDVNKDTLDSFNIKTDANLSAADRMTGRISQQRGSRLRSSWMPNQVLGGNGKLDATNVGLTYTHIFSPSVVNEARAGYNYLNFGNSMLNQDEVIDPAQIPGYNVLSFARGYPSLSIRNYTSAAAVRPIASVPNPFFLVENTWQYMDNLSINKGSHAIKLGVEYGRVGANRFQGRNGGGSVSYNGSYTTPVIGAVLEAARNGVPDMLLGTASAFSTQYAFDAVRIHSVRTSAFIQDDWRVTPKLTLNLGLRWDYFGPYHEEQDRFANFDPTTGIRLVPESARSVVQNTLGSPGGALPDGWQYVPLDRVIPQPNYRNFSPRFGFAYSGLNKIVLRGGYGIFYGVTVSNNFNNSGTEGNPFFFDYSLPAEISKPIIVSQGFPVGGALAPLATNTFSAYYGPLNRHDPYTEKWNFNIQMNPFQKTAIEIGYSGQNARAFSTLVPGNTPSPGPGDIQARRPYPNVGFFWQYVPVNDSNFHALEISFRQQDFHGLVIQSAFTFSKALGYDQGTDATLNDPYNLRYDYGPLTYDVRKRWVTAVAYNIPTPTWNRFTKVVLGNWNTSGLLTLQGGFPFTVGVSGPTLNNGAGTNRANELRDPNLPTDQRNQNQWFDTSAFSTPPNYVWGAQGNNTLRGPGLAQLDFAIEKRIPVRESMRFTFRMESQNFLNRVQLGQPAATLNGANFGVIRSLQGVPRNIQFVGRFEF